MKTISEHLLPYRAYLADAQQKLTEDIRTLEAQNRQDEANMAKIRLNIFSVFETSRNCFIFMRRSFLVVSNFISGF